MLLPNELWEIVLSNILDPENLSNCRKTCSLFNDILTKRTKRISDISSKISLDISSKISLDISSKISLDFVLSFPNLQILDVPIFISNHQQFYLLEKLSKITLRVDSNKIISLLLFLLDYKTLKNKFFKIYIDNIIIWLKEGTYAKIGGKFETYDNALMKTWKCKTLITNLRKRPETIQNLIFLSSVEELKERDYLPDLNLKSYSWRPIKSKKCLLKSSPLNRVEEVRPYIERYEMPILIEHQQKMRDIFINCKHFGTLTNSLYYSSYEDKIIDLEDELPKAETFIDRLYNSI